MDWGDDWDGQAAKREMARRYPELDGDACADSVHQAVGLADGELWEMCAQRGLAPHQQGFNQSFFYFSLALREPTGQSARWMLEHVNFFDPPWGEGPLAWEALGDPAGWSAQATWQAHDAAFAADPRKWLAALGARPSAERERLAQTHPWGLIRAGAPEAADFLGAASSWGQALQAIEKGAPASAREASKALASWREKILPARSWLAVALDRDLAKALRGRVLGKLALADALEAAATLGRFSALGEPLYAEDVWAPPKGSTILGHAMRAAQGGNFRDKAPLDPNVGLSCLCAGSGADIEAAASLGWIEPLRLVDRHGKQWRESPAARATSWWTLEGALAFEKLAALGRCGFPLLDDADPQWPQKLSELEKKHPKLAALNQAQQIEAMSSQTTSAASRGSAPRL